MKMYVGAILLMFLSQGRAVDLNQLLSGKLYLHVKVEPSQKIIETEVLKKFYELNGFANFWTAGGKPNEAALALRQILLQAESWGLSSSQYLPPELKNLFENSNDRNSVTLEILLSDAYLKFAQELANGQILDPDLIDEDIKMPRKSFDFLPVLVDAAKRPERLSATLDSLTPQHEKYKKLISLLKKLTSLKTKNSWEPLVDPKIELAPGAKHQVLIEVKKRLNDLGYPISNQTNVYDAELQKAVARYQELNGLVKTRSLSRSFFRSLSPDLQYRIDKTEANIEKFRWFPQVWESRHLMVNLAFQEMVVVENGQTVMSMKTVNGRPTRRTPTMRDEIWRLDLSPTWTVPYSIARKDKLPDLQERPDAWDRMGIVVYDSKNQPVDPKLILSGQLDIRDLKLVQKPGKNNALGLVKFWLTNDWFIYLHDTNDHALMKETDRLRSSGCIRLEDPFKLAQYLLRDQPLWTVNDMKTPRAQPLPIMVRQKLPSYFLYQTVDVTAAGEVRTAVDEYGQDQRLIELFQSRGSREKF